MKVKQLNQWLALIANTGVFIGLIFLIIELNQANRIATADAESSMRDKSIELWSWTAGDPTFAELLVKLEDPRADLTPEEDKRANAYAQARINLWATAQANYNNGILSDSTYGRYAVDTEMQLDLYPRMIPYYADFIEGRRALIEESPIFLRLMRALEARGYEL